MARCPFAVWQPISGSSGSYLGGPFKIVHHTTEGSTAAGAMSAFRSNRSDPHFTVDATTIYQHIDTGVAARALRNASGGVQTNRDSAVQIEVVGFAGHAKDPQTLRNVARLCRWIEQTHGISQVWPNGFPRPARNGADPGGHNRNVSNWDNQGGHYGHCHVPENTHWDPAYTRAELGIVMGGVLREGGAAVRGAAVPETLDETILSPEPPVEVEIDNFRLLTYVVKAELDEQGQGSIPLDVAWERVSALIPLAERDAGGYWKTCTAFLAVEDGQTFLIVTGGLPQNTVTVHVKVLDMPTASLESEGCPQEEPQIQPATGIPSVV